MGSSHAHIDQMIFGAVQACAPEVAEQCRRNMQSTTPFAVPSKPVVLHALLAAKGPQAVLDIAYHFPQAALGSPMLFFVLNSASPLILIEKLTKYARYFHPHRVVELCEAGENYLEVQNQCHDTRPAAEDELFVCSVLRVLLGMIGCQGIQIEWKTVSSERLGSLLEQIGITCISTAPTTRWHIQWKEFQRPSEIPGLNQFFQMVVQTSANPVEKPVTRAVRTKLMADLRQRPSLEHIASHLGMSVRSLQRALAQEGTSFFAVFNQLRIETAEFLLRKQDLTFGDIGSLSGFSDAAHFNREFKKAKKMTPAQYQQMLVTGQNITLES